MLLVIRTCLELAIMLFLVYLCCNVFCLLAAAICFLLLLKIAYFA